MIEILQKVPSEAWIGLSGVIIGAFISILGFWLTNRANISQLQLQLNHEKETHKKNLNRERLEELYVLIGNWQNAMFVNSISLSSVMKGETTYNEHIDSMIKNSSSKTSDFTRLEMIVNLYAHSIKSEYDKIIGARSELNDIETNFKLKYKEVGPEHNDEQFLEPYMEAQSKLKKNGDDFKKTIADYVKNI